MNWWWVMEEIKKMVPTRRFREFQNAGDWQEYRLGDIAKFSKGKGYLKGDLIESGTPIILYGRLYTEYKTLINDVDTFVKIKKGSVVSVGGEVIIPSSGETSEDIARASVVEGNGIILGGDLNILKLGDNVIPIFLALSISYGDLQKELASKAQGKSVVHIHTSDIKEIIINSPSISEQEKIGEFLKLIDNLITLQQRKLKKIKAIKKAYLNEMFPAEGETKPKRRFKGFNDDWEQFELGNLMNVTSVKRIHQSDWTTTGIRFLRARDIVSVYKNQKPDEYLYISKEKFETKIILSK